MYCHFIFYGLLSEIKLDGWMDGKCRVTDKTPIWLN